ncbi:hypothetical protein OKW43_000123 [Paraburkholderia sp. WC7.3g]
MRSFDNPACPQHLQPFSQRGPRYAQFDDQASLGRQRLTRFQYTVDNQALYAFSDRIRDLQRVLRVVFLHGMSHWSDHFSETFAYDDPGIIAARLASKGGIKDLEKRTQIPVGGSNPDFLLTRMVARQRPSSCIPE